MYKLATREQTFRIFHKEHLMSSGAQVEPVAGGPVIRQLTPAEQQLVQHQRNSLTLLIDTQATQTEEGREIPEELFNMTVELVKQTLRWTGGM